MASWWETDPVVQDQPKFDTELTPSEESEYRKWKARVAPTDDGTDYDFRGAFKARVSPDPETGHWPDTFKKPNHPTFSDQSVYARVAPDRAGHWDGDTFIPASSDWWKSDPVIAEEPSDTSAQVTPDHSPKWNAAQTDMQRRAAFAGLPSTADSRQRLIDAIGRAETAGFKTRHFIGLPNEPTGDRGVTRDIENLVASLKQQEASLPPGQQRDAIAKQRQYWEDEARTGMTAEEWTGQTGEHDPLYPEEQWQPQTAADLMSSRFDAMPLEQRKAAMKRIHIPTINEVGIIPAPIIEAAMKYVSPVGWAQMASEAIEPGNAASRISKGVTSGAANTLAGFTTPEGLQALAIMPQSRIGQILLGLGFEAKAVADVPAQVKAYGATGDPQEKAKIATEIAASIGLPAMAVAHGVSPRAEVPQGPRRWPEPDPPIETEPVKTTEQVAPSREQPPQVPPVSEGDILIPVDERGQPHPSIASDVQRQRPVEVPVPQPEASTPEVESATGKTVRLYHGGSAEQAGSDFTTSYEYAKGYADKAVGDGKVWYVDVPEGSLKTHDEYGQPMSRVIVPDEIADQAKVFGQEASTASPVQEAPAQETTTGVANRVLKAEADAGRIEPVEPGEGMSWQEMVDLGREKLNAGADPQMIARRFQHNGRISAEDFAVIRAERERLAGETMAAENAVRQNPNDVNARNNYNAARQAETEWVRNVVQPAKTATSDIFRGMQGEAPIDPTTFAGLRKAVLDIHGRDVAPNEVGTLSAISERTRRAVAESSESLQRAAMAVENTLGRKVRPRSIEELREHLANRIREITPCP